MNLGFRGDVNTLRWFVQDQNLGSDRKPARQCNLLLIAARESANIHVRRGRFHSELPDILFGEVIFFPTTEPAKTRDAPQTREADIGKNRHLQYDPMLPAV